VDGRGAKWDCKKETISIIVGRLKAEECPMRVSPVISRKRKEV